MSVTVSMYDKTLKNIAPRLDALALDIEIVPFNADGQFLVNGATVSPSEVEIDYLWLSPEISADKIHKQAFGLAVDCKSIGVLQTFNAGLDHPAYKKISDKGVRICNSSAQATGIAEYVMAHVLDVFHPMARRRELQVSKTWEVTPFREISRSNWLIFGFGPIGQGVAMRAKAFGATTTVVRRSPETSDIVDKAGTLADLPAFLPEADVIVLACPLNNETRGFADAGFFAQLKKGAVLVNIARGALIDDTALIAALDNGQVSDAVLDVFHTEPLPTDDPLWSHPKVRFTCHTSFSGSGVRRRWEDLFLDNIARFVKGEPLANVVNPDDIA
jgi:phosphoglycerate dehydrogenase-like enzyme